MVVEMIYQRFTHIPSLSQLLISPLSDKTLKLTCMCATKDFLTLYISICRLAEIYYVYKTMLNNFGMSRDKWFLCCVSTCASQGRFCTFTSEGNEVKLDVYLLNLRVLSLLKKQKHQPPQNTHTHTP